MRLLAVTFILISLAFSNLHAGDVLILPNGNLYEGKVVKLKGCDVIFKSNGHRYAIPAADIHSLHFEDENNEILFDYLKLSSDEGINKCLEGAKDARMLHGKKGAHVALGFCFGGFAMIGTALADCGPMKGSETMLLSKNKPLFTDYEYIECYKKEAKKNLLIMEAAGWGAFIVLYVGLLVAASY